MVKLIWSRRALDDLDSICDFIAIDSLRYAHLFAERIVAFIEKIPRQPLLGAIVPEYKQEDLRERLFQNYRIVYRAGESAVEIVTITHGARLLPPEPPT
jgi:plasmid stabilization system protein ParE